jgi:hypothetical protein
VDLKKWNEIEAGEAWKFMLEGGCWGAWSRWAKITRCFY